MSLLRPLDLDNGDIIEVNKNDIPSYVDLVFFVHPLLSGRICHTWFYRRLPLQDKVVLTVIYEINENSGHYVAMYSFFVFAIYRFQHSNIFIMNIMEVIEDRSM